MQKHFSDREREVAEGILNGDIRMVSRLLTGVEERDPAAFSILKALYPHTGKAKLIGVTGPAGAGKSTLINALVAAFRKKKLSVGILAIDPSSPFSGGAILGDRLRMHSHFLDKGVFIRSLATRGSWGGISPALFDAIHVLDAMGKDILFIETTGVGQDEVRIAQLAEVVLLVLTPGMGDAVQTMKSGLFEIGSLIALNKADVPGGDQFLEELRENDANRPVIKVSATDGTGLPDLFSELEHVFKKKNVMNTKKISFVREELQWLLYEKLQSKGEQFPFTESLIKKIVLRKKNPYETVEAWEKKA